MLGRLDDGRALVARARRTFEELGQLGFSAAACGEVSAAIEVLSGDFAAAERILSASCDVLERARLTSTFATAAGALAGVIYAQGRYDEADAWTVRAEEAGAADDLDARLAWQPVRAKILARRGEHAAADRVARAVATAVLATDALNRRAWVQLDLAEMRRLIGDEREASRLVANAREDFTAKENVPALERLASAAAV
jgi:hypothetical protein